MYERILKIEREFEKRGVDFSTYYDVDAEMETKERIKAEKAAVKKV